MRKIVAISLALLFMLCQSGLVISLHWCGKKLAHISLLVPDAHPCPCGAKSMKSNCCKDKAVIVKVKTSANKVREFTQLTGGYFSVSINSPYVFSVTPPSIHKLFFAFYHPPPYKPKIPDYIFFNSILI